MHRFASFCLSVCLSVCVLTKIHYSATHSWTFPLRLSASSRVNTFHPQSQKQLAQWAVDVMAQFYWPNVHLIPMLIGLPVTIMFVTKHALLCAVRTIQVLHRSQCTNLDKLQFPRHSNPCTSHNWSLESNPTSIQSMRPIKITYCCDQCAFNIPHGAMRMLCNECKEIQSGNLHLLLVEMRLSREWNRLWHKCLSAILQVPSLTLSGKKVKMKWTLQVHNVSGIFDYDLWLQATLKLNNLAHPEGYVKYSMWETLTCQCSVRMWVFIPYA